MQANLTGNGSVRRLQFFEATSLFARLPAGLPTRRSSGYSPVCLFTRQSNTSNSELMRRLKAAEALVKEMQGRIDTLTTENGNLNGENRRMQADLTRLKALCGDLQDRNEGLSRENKQLGGERPHPQAFSLFFVL